MGFLDSASTMINRGVASAGRSTRSLTLKAQIKELQEKRTEAAAQLGASLFEETRANAAIRGPREALYAAIESIDGQCAALQQELDTIERQAQIAAAPAPAQPCRVCGAPVAPGDLFCTNCGTKVEPQPAYAHAVPVPGLCPKCGAPTGPDDHFCMRCGIPVNVPAPAAAPEPIDAEPEPVELPDAPPAAQEEPEHPDPTKTTEVFPRDAAATEGETSLDNTPPEGSESSGNGTLPESSESSGNNTPPEDGESSGSVIPSEGGEAAAVEGSRAASAGQGQDEVIEEPAEPEPEEPAEPAAESSVPAAAPAEPAPSPAAPSFTSVLAADPNKTLPIEDLVGEPIGQQAGLCPQCGYENVPEASFCYNCGQRL